MTEHEQIALQKIRESYASSKRVVEQIMVNHRRVTAMLNMMRAAMILSTQPANNAMVVEYLDAIRRHMEMMIGVIGAMHGVMALVNDIVDMPVIELPERWDGADG